jgi:DNA-binding protein Fis
MALENMTLALAERYLVQHALAQTGGNSDAAAEWLGLSRIAF